jgi:hypothetical protein
MSNLSDRSGDVKPERFYVLRFCFGGGGDILLCLMSDTRRFPPPWSVEEQEACFVVRDHNGQQLAYVYFENEPGRRSAAKLLTWFGRLRWRHLCMGQRKARQQEK